MKLVWTRTEGAMLYTIAIVLLILWLLGLVTSTTLGGFIHILLVIALVVVLLRVISGRGIRTAPRSPSACPHRRRGALPERLTARSTRVGDLQ